MKICSLTDVGRKREMNQDYLYTSEEPVGRLANLFLVADGMGGHKAGEFASRNAVERIVRSVQKNRKKDETLILTDAIQAANQYLAQYAETHKNTQGMGTTVVAATLRGSQLTVANVGDSRLYVIEDAIRQVTVDHSLVQEMIRMGEIAPEDARNHPDKNIITRAVGVEKDVEAEIFQLELRPGAYILLCSDGLSNMVSDREMQEIILSEGTITERAERLLNTANQNGGRDNITLILIETDSEGTST